MFLLSQNRSCWGFALILLYQCDHLWPQKTMSDLEFDWLMLHWMHGHLKMNGHLKQITDDKPNEKKKLFYISYGLLRMTWLCLHKIWMFFYYYYFKAFWQKLYWVWYTRHLRFYILQFANILHFATSNLLLIKQNINILSYRNIVPHLKKGFYNLLLYLNQSLPSSNATKKIFFSLYFGEFFPNSPIWFTNDEWECTSSWFYCFSMHW